MIFGDLEWCKKEVERAKYRLKNLREDKRAAKKKYDELAKSVNFAKEDLEMAKTYLRNQLEGSKK